MNRTKYIELAKTCWFWIPMLLLDVIFLALERLGDNAEAGRRWISRRYYALKEAEEARQ